MTRIFLTGSTTILLLFVWMLTGMHMCALHSLWLEIPLLIGFMWIFPRRVWQSEGSAGALIYQAFKVLALAFGFVIAYITWLHTPLFPRFLLT